jgi:hypothetical protein
MARNKIIIYYENKTQKHKNLHVDLNRDRCYDFLNIFAKKFCDKIGVFDSK